MKLVIDTNVLVSGTLNPERKPGQLVVGLVEKVFTPVISPSIFAEYQDVLTRPKFGFDPFQIGALLEAILLNGQMVYPLKSTLPLPDEKDRPFFDAALAADCPLVTGNPRHFPPETGPQTLSPAEVLARILT